MADAQPWLLNGKYSGLASSPCLHFIFIHVNENAHPLTCPCGHVPNAPPSFLPAAHAACSGRLGGDKRLEGVAAFAVLGTLAAPGEMWRVEPLWLP